MASTSTLPTKHAPPKRLAELLEEQQDPFVLEIYLLERGCTRKSLDLQGGVIGCCSTTIQKKLDSSRFVNRSFSYHGQNPSRKLSSGQFSSIARAFFNKLVWINNEVFRLKKFRLRDENHGSKNKKETVESGRCSSVSCSSLSNNTWYESDTDGQSMVFHEENVNNLESVADGVMTQWSLMEENKQCSPVSVLEEIDLLQSIPVYNVRQNQEAARGRRSRVEKKVSEDSILSASLWQLLLQPKQQQPTKLHYMMNNSKKALLQTRQLLFDCVREVRQQRRDKQGRLIGPQVIGKIICDDLINSWGRLSDDETTINDHVLRMELLGLGDDDWWGCFEVCKREIIVEVGNCVFDDIVDEIVGDLIDLF